MQLYPVLLIISWLVTVSSERGLACGEHGSGSEVFLADHLIRADAVRNLCGYLVDDLTAFVDDHSHANLALVCNAARASVACSRAFKSFYNSYGFANCLPKIRLQDPSWRMAEFIVHCDGSTNVRAAGVDPNLFAEEPP